MPKCGREVHSLWSVLVPGDVAKAVDVVYDITLSTVHCVLRQAVPSMFFLSLWDMSRWQYCLSFTTEEVDPKRTSEKPPPKTQNKKTPGNPQVMC